MAAIIKANIEAVYLINYSNFNLLLNIGSTYSDIGGNVVIAL